jgi:hypothetical protein
MHHTEYAIGEAAGVLAAQCVEKGLAPASVHASAERTNALQERLAARGVAMRWPWEK